MALLYLSEDGLAALLSKLYDWGDLYWVNTPKADYPRLCRAAKEEIPDYRLPLYRGVEPIKGLISPPKQKVAEYPGRAGKETDIARKKRVIFGITQCDLTGIRIFDRVFIEDEEYIDPFYAANREGLFLVTIDCSDVRPSCFCNLVRGQPYPLPEQGFDLNLTRLDEGYLIETGSGAGEDVIRGVGASQATETIIASRDRIRKSAAAKLERQNAPFKTDKSFTELVTENQEEPKSYGHHGSTCVSCGACTHICPGCSCFGILDNPKGGGTYERLLTWDSCQFSGFSRMAGMLNPRGRLAQRFMHRYNHKFFHYPWRYDGWPSCVGCGRCIDNCMGRIDMRATLRDLSVSNIPEMYPSPSPAPGEDPRGKTDRR